MSVFRRGSKRELFLGDVPVETEQQELQAKLLELHALWSQQKDGHPRDMSLGVFHQELQLVKVVHTRGNILQHMGFTWKSSLHVFMEEAVYLMDRGSMLLLDRASGRTISLPEAFSLMVACGCNIERYLVYSHLMRSALYVRRHPAVWTIPKTETPAQACKTAAWLYVQPQTDEIDAVEGPKAEDPDARPGGEQPPLPPPADLDVTLAISRLLDCHGPGSDVGQGDAATDSPVNKRQRCLPGSEPQRSEASRWWPGLSEVHPWLQYREEDAAALPRCEVAAAVPAEATSGQLRCPITSFPAIDTAKPSSAANLVFDVFKGNSKLSRKSPDSPMAHVCFASSPPSVSEARAAAAAAHPRPALFALVEDGVVTLYQAAMLNLSCRATPRSK